MGAISKFVKSGEGRALWAKSFGPAPGFGVAEAKWRGGPAAVRPVPGGSYGRSVLGGGKPGEESMVRLLRALRSNAPGNWTDDRYEQTLRHFVGITYVAIHRIATQISRAEFQVFREDPHHPDGKRPVTRQDPAYDLVSLLKRPNKQDTFGRLMYRLLQQKMLTGTALIWKVPNLLGHPYELYSIPTALAIPQASTNPDYPDGFYRIQPVYPYGPFSSFPSPASSVGAPIGAQWIMRFQYPHPLLRWEGYSPQTAMRLHIDAIEMIDRTRHHMMRKGVYPSAVLNGTDAEGVAELDDDAIERIRAEFENEHQGPENAGRLLVAYAGWKLEQWGALPDQMAFEGGWEQLSSFILGGGFGITKPAAGMVEDSSYQTLFATMKQLHLVTLEPECEDIGASLTLQLAPHYGDDLIVEVRVPRIDDHEVTFSKISTIVQAKCGTKNEVRHMLGMPLTHEEWGADIAGEMPQPEQPPGMPGMPPADPSQDPDPLAAIMGAAQAPAEDAGALSEGSLGPEMGSMLGGKSLYHAVREIIRHGD